MQLKKIEVVDRSRSLFLGIDGLLRMMEADLRYSTWWRMQVESRLSSGWKKPRHGDEYDQGDACVGRKVFVEMFGEGTYY